MTQEERNALEELDYLSGCIRAHEVYIRYLKESLTAKGLLTVDPIGPSLPPSNQPEEEFNVGYRETIQVDPIIRTAVRLK